MNSAKTSNHWVAGILLVTLCLAGAIPALAAGRRHHSSSNQKPPPPPKENFWTITAVDATSNSVSATHSTGEAKVFKTTPGTSVTINGKADKLASVEVGMHAKFAIFGDDMLSRIEVKSAAGGSGAAKKKK